MSFDLGFWIPSNTPIPAHDQYTDLVNSDEDCSLPSSDALLQFYESILTKYPDLSEENFESSPWAAPVYTTSRCIIVSIVSSRKDEVAPVLIRTASHYEVACYDPQVQELHLPGARAGEGARLELADGNQIDSPDGGIISRALHAISQENWYAILDMGPAGYIQVGRGEPAGVPDGTYALEYRDPVTNTQYRTLTRDLSSVVEGFQRFSAGDDSWRHDFDFHAIRVDG